MTYQEMYNSIPVGAENAKSRGYFETLWSMPDRGVRRTIEQMRNDKGISKNYIIMSSSGGRGYYRTNRPEEIDHFIAETKGRALGQLVRVGIAKKVRQNTVNMPLFEDEEKWSLMLTDYSEKEHVYADTDGDPIIFTDLVELTDAMTELWATRKWKMVSIIPEGGLS